MFIGAGYGGILIPIVMFALLWFVLIRPQKAKQQRQRQLLSAVAPGDEILTVGGIFGIVQDIDEDDELIVEIADGVHVRIARKAIATVVKPDPEDDADEMKAIEAGQAELVREAEEARIG